VSKDLTIVVEFGDGSSQSRKINNFSTKSEERLNRLTLSFDIPAGDLEEDDIKTIQFHLGQIAQGKDPGILKLKYVPKSTNERTFDSLVDFFFHHFKSGSRYFWIKYSTWQDFWKKIQGVFWGKQPPQGLKQLVVWDDADRKTYDLSSMGVPKWKDRLSVTLSDLLTKEITKAENTVFVLEDIDSVLRSNDSHETTKERALLKNLLDTNFFKENNNYLICAGNATEEIEIPIQLRGYWVTYRDSSRDFPVLESLGRDLTAEALVHKDTPTQGREKEIQQLLEIFSKSKYNNALLVGRPGVGKTQVGKFGNT